MCAGGFRGREGAPHLSQDLSLSQHHRFDPGGHAEEVPHRLPIGHVIEGIVRCGGNTLQFTQQRDDRFLGDDVRGREINLGPVASREHDRRAAEVRQYVRQLVLGKGDALPHRDRSGLVANPN